MGLYTNVKYELKLGWTIVNQVIAFAFFIIIYKRFQKSINFLTEMKNIVTNIFFISNILSIIYWVIGGEAIRFYNFSFQFRRQGIFNDTRLTFVYTHKSVYGLLLFLVLIMLVKDKNIVNRAYKIVTILITLLLVNSAVSIVCSVVFVMYYILKNVWKKMSFWSKVIFAFIAGVILVLACIFIYYIVGKYRNINNLGGRIAIWSYALGYLSKNKIGIGDAFGAIYYSSKQLGFSFNNFHNVFLNEMLQISVLEGFIFIALFMMIYYKAILNSNDKFETILCLILLLIPFMFDQAISTAFLPIYFLLFYLTFLVDCEGEKQIRTSF